MSIFLIGLIASSCELCVCACVCECVCVRARTRICTQTKLWSYAMKTEFGLQTAPKQTSEHNISIKVCLANKEGSYICVFSLTLFYSWKSEELIPWSLFITMLRVQLCVPFGFLPEAEKHLHRAHQVLLSYP